MTQATANEKAYYHGVFLKPGDTFEVSAGDKVPDWADAEPKAEPKAKSKGKEKDEGKEKDKGKEKDELDDLA